MLFVLCNVKLGKYRRHGMKGGMTRASLSATDAPWETACIQGTVAGISASHTLIRQPLLRISCPWRSWSQPCPALLHVHCAWEVHSPCSRVNEDWVNILCWIQPGSVLVVQILYLWVATGWLQLRGELLLKYPDAVEQYQAWNRDGVLLICALQEQMWKVKSGKAAPCVLVGFCMRGVAIFTFFMPCPSGRLHSVSKGYFAWHQFCHCPSLGIPNGHLI